MPRRRTSAVELFVICGDVAVLLGCYTILLLAFEEKTDPLHLLLWSLTLMAVWLFVGAGRVYGGATLGRPLQSAYVAAKVTLITGAVFYLLPLVGGANHSRISNVVAVLVLATVMATWRVLLASVIVAPTEDLVVVGAGWAGQALADAVVRTPEAGFRIVGFVDADPRFIGCSLHGALVHPIEHLTELARRRNGLARVVLANSGHAHAAVFEQLTLLGQFGVDVVQMSSLYEQVTGRIPVHHLGNYWWAVLPRPSAQVLYWLAKRLVDIMVALMGLALLAVLLPVLWLVLWLQTGGSPFFSQERIGKYGRPFTLHKLRTLPVASAQGGSWRERKAANRPTRVCELIRSMGMDELPQLVNVLRGEMSLVGPRPYVPEEVEELQQRVPFFRNRSLVRPGITGWAQVNYGYGMSLEDEVEKFQHDLFYIGHQSVYLDLLILLRTCGLVLRGRRPASRVSLSAMPRGVLYDTSSGDSRSAEEQV